MALKYRLEPLSADATEAYVHHRLKLAGRIRGCRSRRGRSRGSTPTPGASPRIINTLCDNALFEGFVARQRDVDEALVDRVARDLDLQVPAGLAPEGNGERPRVNLAELDRYLESLGGK